MKSNAIYLRFRITLFYFIILFFSSLVSAQEKGIILKDKKIGEIEFLRENKRIKVVTSDGNHFIGRFKIIDDKTYYRFINMSLSSVYLKKFNPLLNLSAGS